MAKGFINLKSVADLYNNSCIVLCKKAFDGFERHSRLVMFFVGVGLLYLAGSNVAYAGSGSYGMACNGILQLVEGTFGALITAAAGIGAIIASAVGGFKMAWSLVVVSVGAFILRSYITLFNGDCA